MSVVKSYLGVRMIKKALPLRQSLDVMNEQALETYTVVKKEKIQNNDLLEELGTEDYIQWTLEDTEAGRDDPLRYCSLFITYYTGNPDQVPHVPEECYFGGGNQRFGTDDLVFKVPMPSNPADEEKKVQNIPARCLVFGKKQTNMWQGGEKFPVFYTFKVNGAYKGNRDATRLKLMSNITGEYSYFSKIEWKFYNVVFGRLIYPDKDDAIRASEKLLSVLLPILEKDHWPDWQKAMQKG